MMGIREAQIYMKLVFDYMLFLVLGLMCLIAFPFSSTARAEALASSTFDTGDEGWTVISLKEGLPTYTPDHAATGGNPGGYILETDPDNSLWFWRAPTSFHGDMSSAYNGNISFHLKQSDLTEQHSHSTGVNLYGAGLQLNMPLPHHPGTHWTPYTLVIHESAGWTNETSGNPATPTDLQSVLSDIEDIWILGEFRVGTEVGGLDNVTLSSAQNANVTMFTDKNAYLATTSDPHCTIDFETFGDGTNVTGSPFVSGDEWGNLGITFLPEDGASLLQLAQGNDNWTPTSPTHGLYGDASSTSFILLFDKPVTSFGLTLCDNELSDRSEQIALYSMHGNTLGLFELPFHGAFTGGTEANYFRGFRSTTPISKVVIHENPADGEGMLLDDVIFSAVDYPPQVSDVVVSQRSDDSKLIDIHYDLYDDKGYSCTVSVQVSNDGGATWTVAATSFTGDIGTDVTPGTGKHIIWDCKADLPGAVGSNYKVRVIADDGN